MNLLQSKFEKKTNRTSMLRRSVADIAPRNWKCENMQLKNKRMTQTTLWI